SSRRVVVGNVEDVGHAVLGVGHDFQRQRAADTIERPTQRHADAIEWGAYQVAVVRLVRVDGSDALERILDRRDAGGVTRAETQPLCKPRACLRWVGAGTGPVGGGGGLQQGPLRGEGAVVVFGRARDEAAVSRNLGAVQPTAVGEAEEVDSWGDAEVHVVHTDAVTDSLGCSGNTKRQTREQRNDAQEKKHSGAQWHKPYVLHLSPAAVQPNEAIGFLNDLFCGRSYIAAPAELSIPFLLDEKSTVVPVRLIHGFSQYSGVKRLRHIEAQHGLLIASLL